MSKTSSDWDVVENKIRKSLREAGGRHSTIKWWKNNLDLLSSFGEELFLESLTLANRQLGKSTEDLNMLLDIVDKTKINKAVREKLAALVRQQNEETKTRKKAYNIFVQVKPISKDSYGQLTSTLANCRERYETLDLIYCWHNDRLPRDWTVYAASPNNGDPIVLRWHRNRLSAVSPDAQIEGDSYQLLRP